MTDENDSYTLNDCACKNCTFEGDVKLRKGVKLGEAVCTLCGNKGGLYRKPQTTTYYKF